MIVPIIFAIKHFSVSPSSTIIPQHGKRLKRADAKHIVNINVLVSWSLMITHTQTLDEGPI